jgi:tetratricopeptide (TPR) repeat protein
VATALHDRGFQTGAFIGGYPLQSASGLNRGFDIYDDAFLNTPGVTERRADAVVQAAGDWIEARGTQPFFAWIHLFDPHSPYDPPAEYAAAHRGTPYDGEIAYTDAAVARLFKRLRRQGLMTRATVIVVADHGESLGEHGERTHGTFLYDATIHVPLLVKLPGQTSSRVIDAPVETADLAPTLAQIADAALPSTDGRSLLPLLDGAAGDPERATYAESYYLNVLLGWSPLRAIRTSQWKYIEAPRPELYDLRADPGELRSVAAARRALADGLGAALGREQGIVFPPDIAHGDAADRLRSLGYASGAMPSTPAARGIDPKDRTAEWSEIERGVDLIASDPAGSAEAFNHVLRLDPANALAMKYLGDLAFRAGRLQNAQKEYTRALGAGLHHPDIYVNLASIAEREGRLTDAASALTQAVRAVPTDADAWNRLGLLDARLNRPADASDAFAKAIAAAPNRAEAYYNAAVMARRTGRDDEARARLQQAIARNPRYADAHYELATLQLTAGDNRGALAEYRAALDARPDYAEALFGAARAELDLQMRDEARRDYERFVRVAPPAYAPQIAAARRVLQQLAAPR